MRCTQICSLAIFSRLGQIEKQVWGINEEVGMFFHVDIGATGFLTEIV